MKRVGVFVCAIVAFAVWPVRAVDEGVARPRAERTASASRSAEKRWRYVWHNDRWWYWMPDESWSSYDGRRWARYDPRRPAPSAMSSAYRKAPAFERPPAIAPRPPASMRGEAVDLIAPFDAHGRVSGGTGASQGAAAQSPLFESSGGAIGRFGSAPGRSSLSPEPRSSARLPARTGSGGFGGPKGGSLGGGSAAGGASTPQ